ncbi:MAG: septal ring lytic transglycosylase RlpA family protein [Desulfatiglandales bacterium]
MKLADYRKMKVLTQGRSFQDVIKNVRAKKDISGQDSPKAEEGTQYIVMPGDTLWDIAIRFGVNLNDLIQDNGIKDPEKLYPGQKLWIRQYDYPKEFEVVASWYGPGYHGRPMANGEIYNMYDSVVAHRDLPFGTKLEIVNPENQARVVAVVKDRGPFIKGRDIDLSYGVARRLGMVEKGVGKVLVKVLA